MNYTDLRMGDNLPMVGVLQRLLNRTGASLVPDGNFGPKTFAAVIAFQKPRRLVPDGIVGEKTWGRLTSGVSLPIVDSVDIWDPTFFNEDVSDVRKAGGNPLVMGGMCNGVEQAVSLLSPLRNVFLLRFHGHGAPGGVGVSFGHGELDPSWQERSTIMSDPVIIKTLGRLRPVFGPYGCIEFISCETGRGQAGKRLLSQIAARVGVPVVGAVMDQPFSRTASFRLSGPTVTAVPLGGSLSNWCRALPTFPGMTVG